MNVKDKCKIKLYNDDCINVLEKMSGSGCMVDLIIIDPPYLQKYKSNHRKDKRHDFCEMILNDTEDYKDSLKQIFVLLSSVLKEGGAFYCFCSEKNIDFFKKEIEKNFKFKNILVWVKNNWTAGDLKGDYAKQTEYLIYAVKGRHLLNGRRDPNVLYYDKVVGKKQLHQNQKPVDLLEYLVEKSSKKGEIVIDCFMGSGSTGVACRNTGRNFVGIELDKKYFDIAKNRLMKK